MDLTSGGHAAAAAAADAMAGALSTSPVSGGPGFATFAGTTPPVATTFVQKLYALVSDPATDHVIYWTPSGTSFIVRNVAEFENLLPRYYKHRQFSSFIRQLNTYQFRKINRNPRGARGNLALDGPTEFEFAHEQFLRGRMDLLDNIKRKSASSSTPAAATAANTTAAGADGSGPGVSTSSATAAGQPHRGLPDPTPALSVSPVSPVRARIERSLSGGSISMGAGAASAAEPGSQRQLAAASPAVQAPTTAVVATTAQQQQQQQESSELQQQLQNVHHQLEIVSNRLAEQTREVQIHRQAIVSIIDWIHSQGYQFPNNSNDGTGTAGVGGAPTSGALPAGSAFATPGNGRSPNPQPCVLVTGPSGEPMVPSMPPSGSIMNHPLAAAFNGSSPLYNASVSSSHSPASSVSLDPLLGTSPLMYPGLSPNLSTAMGYMDMGMLAGLTEPMGMSRPASALGMAMPQQIPQLQMPVTPQMQLQMQMPMQQHQLQLQQQQLQLQQQLQMQQQQQAQQQALHQQLAPPPAMPFAPPAVQAPPLPPRPQPGAFLLGSALAQAMGRSNSA
ncbi:hypothetical protein AMAG_05583 [Allomyces macrogynus ATCC 38327]|uniref:HSF-type DNA-binding domain-containing protein n=1 Tax=Allomyces macrogynus (strain ATCC 38327) TaxID=578462 RepID=A0A0L0SC81_ALLM3|nr:hypothetical protein AMAG_05583 [Allomyces macrogynus ATCC 38327]|eukprot:KNE60163.1 hypothetical protein AMAG_05583 [Allomyces macrogynus ATCC 38327]